MMLTLSLRSEGMSRCRSVRRQNKKSHSWENSAVRKKNRGKNGTKNPMQRP